MNQFEYIITSGCSFSDPVSGFTWPVRLSASYKVKSDHVGLSSQGNGLIARKALYAVHKAMSSGVDPAKILVGIMWSGPDRHDTYISNLNGQLPDEVKNIDFMAVNPTSYVDGDPGGWLIMNHHWKEKTSKIYYCHLHDYVNQRINTYEKILWVQSQLKLLGIRYFMVPFTKEVFSDNFNDEAQFHSNPNIAWMKKLIDWSQWLPVKSMHDWCYTYWTDDDFDKITFQQPQGDWMTWPDNHPKDFMHKRFVKEVVLPHIKKSFPDYYCPGLVETD